MTSSGRTFVLGGMTVAFILANNLARPLVLERSNCECREFDMSKAVRETLDRRIAGAPISWGVCEVPGWGLQMAADRVLSEMREIGLRATELGPSGYLGASGAEIRTRLRHHELSLVGGFVPLVLHDVAQRAALIRNAVQAAEVLAAAGSSVFVTAAVVDAQWSPRITLDADGWNAMFEGFDIVDGICEGLGLVQVLHPHVGTLVETRDDVERVLKGSNVRWCLDTGHLQIGGTDPVEFARSHHDRVAHVHVKDVRMDLARRLNAGEQTLMQATLDGMFCPAGEGDVAIAEVVRHMESAGYAGWYVLEQDLALTEEPSIGSGPINGARKSARFLYRLAQDLT